MVSRVVAYVCLSIAGLPLSGGLSSVCLGGAVSFQDDNKHSMCSCASANCLEGACCCGHHGNAGFNLCGCGSTNFVFLLSETQPATASQNSLRAPFSAEAFEVALYVTSFGGARFSYPLDYSGMDVLFRTCSLRFLTLPIDQAIVITSETRGLVRLNGDTRETLSEADRLRMNR